MYFMTTLLSYGGRPRACYIFSSCLYYSIFVAFWAFEGNDDKMKLPRFAQMRCIYFISRKLAVVDPTAYVQTLLLGVLHVATSCLHREIGCPLPVILCTGYCKQCPFSTPSVSSFSLPLQFRIEPPHAFYVCGFFVRSFISF